MSSTTTNTTTTSDKQGQDRNHRERELNDDRESERECGGYRGHERGLDHERDVDHRNHERERERERDGIDDDVSIRDYPIPEEFKKMNNLYEMAHWVTMHPDVLHLANGIHKGIETRYPRSILETPPVNDVQVRTRSSTLCKRTIFFKFHAQQSLESTLMTACKGLFTRTRSINKSLSAEVISRVYRIEKSDALVKTLSSKMRKWFCDWRYTLKRALTYLAESHKAL